MRACVHLSVSGAWYSGHGDVCMSMPTLQGHMEGMGRVVSVQGANEETINRHCPNKARESWMGEGCDRGYKDQIWFHNLIYK